MEIAPDFWSHKHAAKRRAEIDPEQQRYRCEW